MKNKLGQVGIAALVLSLALVGTIAAAETNETSLATPTPETSVETPTPVPVTLTPTPTITPFPTPSSPAPEVTTTPAPTPEGNATPQPNTPTPIPPKSEPEIEITYPSKLTRGDATELKATVKNAGSGEIRITSLSWSLPSGFDIAAKQEDCNVLQPGASCNSVVAVKTAASAALGKNDVKVVVSYD